MVSVVKRMRALKTKLLNMRVGLGAALLPPTTSTPGLLPVTRVHLTYARKIYEGHGGPRKFWRVCLPRLKYHNPALAVTVKQTTEQEGPAILSVYFKNEAAVAAEATAATTNSQQATTAAVPPAPEGGEEQLVDEFAPPPTESEIVRRINVKRKTVRHIWDDFKQMTGAEDIPLSEEDKAEIEEMQRQKELSDLDRKRVAENRQMIKDQEKLLEAAREDVKRLRAEE
ncbi:50S ribosomal protein Mrp49 [Blastomyces gilchristii SLH14081]|uniref:50S ribosomal protein Mrp49 n=2 Tax=Blastomyces TaxID=229219 RepID=A0A179U6E0_BLAGS|nr:50S ribosomal protein Mrp49 [Blastomyces gilchristii SLH14081]EGE78181.2 50S ribosomal protein Mrp49 [Blastomyces dermatitidis ATCC 18188]OAT03586.1 50S ribosomal protein Mrp49 [Blastomyces gilchristii SLH14081]